MTLLYLRQPDSPEFLNHFENSFVSTINAIDDMKPLAEFPHCLSSESRFFHLLSRISQNGVTAGQVRRDGLATRLDTGRFSFTEGQF